MLVQNISRRIDSVVNILSNLTKPRISNTEKSSYYRSALILLYTIVEGLTYEYARKSTAHLGHVIGEKTNHKQRMLIKKKIFSSQGDFCICEKIKSNILISDTNGDADFGKLILFLKNNSMISKKEYSLINWVRTERNKIHLQGLSLPDTGYNKLKLKKTNKAIQILMRKILQTP